LVETIANYRSKTEPNLEPRRTPGRSASLNVDFRVAARGGHVLDSPLESLSETIGHCSGRRGVCVYRQRQGISAEVRERVSSLQFAYGELFVDKKFRKEAQKCFEEIFRFL